MISKLEWQIIMEYLRNDTRLRGDEITRFRRIILERIKSSKKRK